MVFFAACRFDLAANQKIQRHMSDQTSYGNNCECFLSRREIPSATRRTSLDVSIIWLVDRAQGSKQRYAARSEIAVASHRAAEIE
jgi:hypothetical protein